MNATAKWPECKHEVCADRSGKITYMNEKYEAFFLRISQQICIHEVPSTSTSISVR